MILQYVKRCKAQSIDSLTQPRKSRKVLPAGFCVAFVCCVMLRARYHMVTSPSELNSADFTLWSLKYSVSS